jgi:hypothetical protein
MRDPHTPDPLVRLLVRERLRALAAASISATERRALSLQAAGGSYADIEALTGWSRRKIERSIAEGRAKLRRLAA